MGCATIVRLPVLVLASWGVSTAYADGVCEKGFRDTTATERQTMLGVMEAAKAALPSAPTGWVIGGYEELSPVGRICLDAETTPWAFGFSRTFNRTDDQAEREAALADAGAAARAAQAARQPRMDALQAKMEAVSAEFAKAAQSGDEARIAASQRAMDAVSAEYTALFAEAEDPQLLESIVRATEHDRTMSIAIAVNPGAFYDSDMQSVAPFGGAQAAYRWTTSNDGIETAHVVLLYGAWQPRDGGGVTSSRRGTASAAAAHALSVREADPGRLDSLLGTLDFDALAALAR
jgi:hypothetical protein